MLQGFVSKNYPFGLSDRISPSAPHLIFGNCVNFWLLDLEGHLPPSPLSAVSFLPATNISHKSSKTNHTKSLGLKTKFATILNFSSITLLLLPPQSLPDF